MSEMAGYELEWQEESCNIAENHRFSSHETRYELGLIDEYGIEQYNGRGNEASSRSVRAPFNKNHLYHHTKLKGTLLKSTEKGIYFRVDFHGSPPITMWLPKKLCREIQEESVWVWDNFWQTKIKEFE